MADSRGIRAGKAFVELTTDSNPLTKGLRAASAMLHGWGSSLTFRGAALAGGGAAITAPFAAAVASTVDRVGELAKLSEKIGASSETLSGLAYAARVNGVSVEELGGHFENLSERVFQAAQGGGEAADALKRIGIDAKELIGLSLPEQLIKLSDAMQGVTNSTERLGLLSAFGGDQFQNLNQLLKEGPAGIRRLMAEGGRLGAVVTAADARAVVEFSKGWTTLKEAVGGTFAQAGLAVIKPAVEAWGTYKGQVIAAAESAQQFVAANGPLLAGVAAGGAALVGLGGAVAGTGVALSVAATAAGGFATAVSAVLSPVGLLTAGVAGLGYAWATETESGQRFTSEVGSQFRTLAAEVGESWGAISGAFAAGDLQGAWEVALSQLKLSWTEVSHFFGRTFGDTIRAVLGELEKTFNGWAADIAAVLVTLEKTGTAIAFAGPGGLLLENIKSGVGHDIDAIFKGRDELNREVDRRFEADLAAREQERRAELDAARKRRLEAIAAAVAAENAALWDRAFEEDAPAGRRDPFAGIGQQMAAARGTFGSFGLSRSLGGSEPVQKAMLKELQGMNTKLQRLVDEGGERFTD